MIVDIEEFAEFIKSRGGTVSVREAQRSMRRLRTAHDAEKALGEIVKAGLAEWVTLPTNKQGHVSRGVKLLNGSIEQKIETVCSFEAIEKTLYELARKIDEIHRVEGGTEYRDDCILFLKQLTDKLDEWRVSE